MRKKKTKPDRKLLAVASCKHIGNNLSRRIWICRCMEHASCMHKFECEMSVGACFDACCVCVCTFDFNDSKCDLRRCGNCGCQTDNVCVYYLCLFCENKTWTLDHLGTNTARVPVGTTDEEMGKLNASPCKHGTRASARAPAPRHCAHKQNKYMQLYSPNETSKQ